MEPKELLAKARQMVARMRADGVPDADIDQYLQSEIQLGLEQVTSPDVDDYLRAGGMGMTAGFLDELAGAGAAIVPGGKGYTEARDEVRTNYDAANEAATGWDQAKLTGAEGLGGLLGAVGGTGAAGWAARGLGMGAKAARATGTAAKALRGARTGAIAGGVAGAGYSDEVSPEAILGGAVAGGVTGGLLPVAGAAMKGAGRWVGDMANPGRAVSREAATQLGHVPGGAANVMARQEGLAPGTAIQGDLSPEMTALMRGVGADPAAAVQARNIAAARIPELQKGLRAVGDQYKQFDKQQLTLTPEIDAVLRKHGTMVSGSTAEFSTIQRLRTTLRERMQATKKGSVKQEIGPDKAVLDTFLRNNVPGLSDIDSNYGFLLERLKMAKLLLREVAASGKNYAAQRAYGKDAGSIGGSLPANSRGMVERLMGLLEPNRADRARAAQHLLMTPNLAPAVSAAGGEAAGGLLQQWPSTGLGWLSGRAAGGLLGE